MSFERVAIDEVQEYWDRRPCNVRHSTLPIGSEEYSDAVTARKYKVEPHIPVFAEFPKWKGKRVLEIGCGIGTDTISFAQNGAQVTAVDLSSASLDIAKQRMQAKGLTENVTFYQADAEKLTHYVPVERYDLIYSFGVLHHTPHPRIAFENLSWYGDQDTVLKLMLYNRLSWKVIQLTKGKVWDDQAIALQSEAQTGCPVTYTFTRGEIKRILDPWFKVNRVYVDHIFPYKLEPYLNYTYEKNWWAEMPGFREIERLLGWHLMVEATLRWNRS